MGHRRDGDPSPLKAGLVHTGLSLTAFGCLAAMAGAGIHFSGDPAEAGPREHLALFETPADTDIALKSRLRHEPVVTAAFEPVEPEKSETDEEPNLGVEYAEIVEAPAVEEQETSEGIRINGQLVQPGQSYAEMADSLALEPAPVTGLTERVNGLTLPRIGDDGQAPADVYARPFTNPGNQPAVALIIGGLGINATHTRSAIDELPPEVTLSFAPDTRSLQYWINKARAKGHEVLIEVPMEAYDYGRMKMHPHTLRAGVNASENAARMDRLLARASGYFGVVNYQGAKLAADEASVVPLFETLAARGLAFVEDGSLQANIFDDVADQSGLRYTIANATVDTRVTSEDINAQFQELETEAREKGTALGSGYAFPLTIEMAKAWTEGLEAKGLVLAPASALATATPHADSGKLPVRTGSLDIPAVNSGG